MGLRRTIGLAIGFAGALVILRPGLEVINPGSSYALLSAAIWAAAIIVIKVLSRTESSLTITVYAVLFLTPLTLIPALFVWRWPDLEQLAWLAGIGFLGTGAHLLFAQALSHADASLIMPFDFTKLLWAALIGFFFFTEIPVVWTWVGGAVIFTSATYVAYRERIADGAAEPA
jgi:drug/metabolite transporter (DMT)-like permease